MNDLTDYIKKAFEYKNNGDYKEAIDFFYKALAIDNESAEIMSELADLYAKLCQYDRAFSFYDQVISKNPKNYAVKYSYAMLLKSLKEYKKAQEILEELYEANFEIEKVAEELFYICSINKDYAKIISCFNVHSNTIKSSINLYYVALAFEKTGREHISQEYYNKSFDVDKNNIEAGIKVIELLLANDQVQEAENIANNLLQTSEHDMILYLLAEINYNKGHFDDALKYYSYAIKTNPQCALYYFKIAVLFSIKGFFSEAEEAYCKAITIEPNNVFYNYALAYLYYMNNKNKLAEKLVDFILSINENNSQAIALKIILLIEREEVVEAGKYVDKIWKTQDADDFSYYAKAYYYLKLNAWEKALVAIIKAIELNSDSIEYKFLMAKLYFNLSDNDKAENICEKILSFNPKYIQAYLLISQINLKKKNYEVVLENINKALQLDKNNVEAYSVLAEVYFEKRNWAQAIDNYKIAVSINPKNTEYYSKIAECYMKLEQYKDAYTYFKEAADINISEPEYRYYMAKCCELMKDTENAIACYSILKRVAPLNIKYVEEYANFLYSIKRKKTAVELVKSVMKHVSQVEKNKLKNLISSYR